MRIGIDVSQLAYEKTGVASFLENLIRELAKHKENEYMLFFSSMRRNFPLTFSSKNMRVKRFRFPPAFLDLVWNRLHILPIEKLIGPFDIFVTSDWTEPPSKFPKATIIYDLTVYKTPMETDKKIIEVQKRKLKWVKNESKVIFCISQATKNDVHEVLGINNDKLKILYPGL